ncbi:hypothetical protein JCM33774_19640 [Actinophytocola sp. KF-1]
MRPTGLEELRDSPALAAAFMGAETDMCRLPADAQRLSDVCPRVAVFSRQFHFEAAVGLAAGAGGVAMVFFRLPDLLFMLVAA